ncbi:Ig-like domain-containing protein [Promicromonospora panici]|uniref:Ig-like domain-containing protein n=1 Tax=Promicromonospora panici TaxID=2219658 RepID=UPI0013EA0CA3|nr:Ig-like domain-containing protein [Promicromonospora panici]
MSGSGAGGSSYIAPQVADQRTEAGQPGAPARSSAKPGGHEDRAYRYAPDVGIGGMTRGATPGEPNGGQAGGGGMLVLQWKMPAPETTTPAEGTRAADPTPVIAGAAGAGNTVTVTDGPAGTTVCTATAASDGTWSCTASSLADGAHDLVATQSSGVAADAYPPGDPVTYTVDTTPPAAPRITGPAATAATDATIRGGGEAGSRVTVRTTSGSAVCGPLPVPPDGTWSCSPDPELVAGRHSLVPFAADDLGNTATGAEYVVTVEQPPVPPPSPSPTPTLVQTPPSAVDAPSAPPPTTAPRPAAPPPQVAATVAPWGSPPVVAPRAAAPTAPDTADEPEDEAAEPEADPPVETPEEMVPPVAAGRPISFDVQDRAGEVLRGEVGRFDATLGPNLTRETVAMTLAGRVDPGFVYRSVQVVPDARCVIARTTFSCPIVLEPGASAQVTIRLLVDALTAPDLARQQLSVALRGDGTDGGVAGAGSSAAVAALATSVTVTTPVADDEPTDTEALAAAITDQPGTFLVLLTLLLYALAATVAERRRSRPTEGS